MNRILVATLMSLMLTSSSLFAAEESGTALTPGITASATSIALRTAPAAEATGAVMFVAPRRPSLLPSLYAGSALLQSFDAYSTMSALKAGGVEANPMMKTVVKNPAAFVAMKASVTAVSVLAAEHLWKNNQRFGAVMMMVASNSAMAMVAAHNASVLRRMR